MTFGEMKTRLGKTKTASIRILLDSGASKSIIFKELAKKLRQKKTSTTEWSTVAGTVRTDHKAKVQLKLSEFSEQKVIEWEFHTTDTKFNYDMIIGRDLLSALGIIIDFKDDVMTWDEAIVPMKAVDATVEDSYFVNDTETKIDLDLGLSEPSMYGATIEDEGCCQTSADETVIEWSWRLQDCAAAWLSVVRVRRLVRSAHDAAGASQQEYIVVLAC